MTAPGKVENRIAWTSGNRTLVVGALGAWHEKDGERTTVPNGFEKAYIEHMEAALAAQAERIGALEEYVNFLSLQVRVSEAFCEAHGIRPSQEAITRGRELRAKIGRREDGTWEKG